MSSINLELISSHMIDLIDRDTDKLTRRYHWWIVLPIILVSMTTTSMDPIIFNDLMIRRFQIEYGLINDSMSTTKAASHIQQLNNDSSYAQLSIQVQTSASRLHMIIAGLGALPALVTYVILGSNCDRIGRRPLLIIPCLGRTIRYIILLLLVQFNLSNTWLILSNVVDGLFGSNSVLLLGAIAYISDCTSNQQRSRAMLLEEAAVALTRIFPLIGLGICLQHHQYTLPIAMILFMNIAALIYIFVCQPESCGDNNRHAFFFLEQLKRIRLTSIRKIYRVFLIQRSQHDQRTIILLVLIQILLFTILFGFVSIHPLYLYGMPLYFNAQDLTLLTSVQFSLMIIISIILSCFQQHPFFNSMLLPWIGTLAYIVHLICFGLARSVWFLYLGKNDL
jgi:MFS transporter, PCFT/HCP family, solute carrier family 46 (folate transporter), member 1